MGIPLSTAGVKIGYGTSKLAEKPTSFKNLPDIKSSPDFNVEPNGLDSTTLAEEVAKQYIEGLRDYGSSIQFTANLTKELIGIWDTWCSEVKEKQKTEATACGWIEIIHPGLDKAAVIPVSPVELGLPAMEVDSILETTLYVTPLGGAEWVVPITISTGEE